MAKDKERIKILVYGDSPAVATGFGKVIEGIFSNLVKTGRYDIDIFGINDRGGYKDPEKYPYRIYPAMTPGEQDFYGRLRFVNVLRGADLDLKPDWDIVFFLQDPFILEQPLPGLRRGLMHIANDIKGLYREQFEPETWWNTVFYIPVDSPIKPNWIQTAIAVPDRSVAYTRYGKREIEKADQALTKPMDVKIDTIYHGANTKDFYPLDPKEKAKFREHFFQGRVTPQTFVVSTVARNQMRKDIPRTMKIFREFQKRRPDSFLYIHAKEQDAWGSLMEYSRQFGLEHAKDWTFPDKFNENTGYPVELLNKIYNVSDLHIINSMGEGWGLPITEAMSAGILNIACNITSIPEMLATEDVIDIADFKDNKEMRGIPIKAMSTSSEWATYGPTDYERIRPLTNVDDAVRKMLWVYDNPEEAVKVAKRGYEWVQTITWESIAEKWDKLFQEVYKNLKRERKAGKKSVIKKDKDKSSQPAQLKSERDDTKPIQQTKGEHKANG